MSTDFLTGFESGIFLRNNEQQFEEYGFPDQHTNSDEMIAFKQALDPIKNFGKLMG